MQILEADITSQSIYFLLFIYLLAFLDTGLSRGNVHERDSGPMQGAIPTQSHNPVQAGQTTGVYDPYSFRVVICEFFYVPQEQISESAVRRDLRFFVLTRED